MSPIGAALGIVAVVAAAAALVAAFLVLRALREIGALRLRASMLGSNRSAPS